MLMIHSFIHSDKKNYVQEFLPLPFSQHRLAFIYFISLWLFAWLQYSSI